MLSTFSRFTEIFISESEYSISIFATNFIFMFGFYVKWNFPVLISIGNVLNNSNLLKKKEKASIKSILLNMFSQLSYCVIQNSNGYLIFY